MGVDVRRESVGPGEGRSTRFERVFCPAAFVLPMADAVDDAKVSNKGDDARAGAAGAASQRVSLEISLIKRTQVLRASLEKSELSRGSGAGAPTAGESACLPAQTILMVLMALTTTFMTLPLMEWVYFSRVLPQPYPEDPGDPAAELVIPGDSALGSDLVENEGPR